MYSKLLPSVLSWHFPYPTRKRRLRFSHLVYDGKLIYYTVFSSAYESDPILAYRPQFARSLPIQILVTGMVLTLVSVLLIHLIFTANYHWRLAQTNCVLQISAATILFTQLVASLKLVLNDAIQESREWPFMLTYVCVDLPPLDGSSDGSGWSTINLALWLWMNATTSALIQVREGCSSLFSEDGILTVQLWCR